MGNKILVGGCSIGTCKVCNHKDKMLDDEGRCDDCVDEIEHEGLDHDPDYDGLSIPLPEDGDP